MFKVPTTQTSYLYVDNLLIPKSYSPELKNLKEKKEVEFEMNRLGKLLYFYGMKFVKIKKDMIMHQ